MTGGVMDGIRAHHARPQRVTLIKNAVDLDDFSPRSSRLARRSAGALRAGGSLCRRPHRQHEPDLRLRHHARCGGSTAGDRPFCSSAADRRQSASRRTSASEARQRAALPGCCRTSICRRSGRRRDVCLIALGDHSVAGGTLPAKLYEALATGTPVVAAIRGEGAALLEADGCGHSRPDWRPRQP